MLEFSHLVQIVNLTHLNAFARGTSLTLLNVMENRLIHRINVTEPIQQGVVVRKKHLEDNLQSGQTCVLIIFVRNRYTSMLLHPTAVSNSYINHATMKY